MSTQTALGFPQIQFMRMTDAEFAGLRSMERNALFTGRTMFALQVGAVLRSDVMTIGQFDALMGAYRHWLNWGFEPAPESKA